MAGRERLVDVFDAMDPVTASDWVQPFDRIGLNGGFRPICDIRCRELVARKRPDV